jgi:hypothetical protein
MSYVGSHRRTWLDNPAATGGNFRQPVEERAIIRARDAIRSTLSVVFQLGIQMRRFRLIQHRHVVLGRVFGECTALRKRVICASRRKAGARWRHGPRDRGGITA